MADDLATLSLRLTNAQAIADAKATGAAYEDMGVKGEAAQAKLAASSNPVTTAIKQQAIDYTQLTARASDFARAGASAAQVSQMAGVSMAQAAAAVKTYSGTVSKAEIDVVGLKAAQAQLALANMEVGETAVVAGMAMNGSMGGIRSMDRALGMIGASAIGANRQLGALGGIMASMGGGGWVTVAVLAGLALIATAFDKLTESSRKAMDAADKLAESYNKAARVASLGIGGQQKADIEDLNKGLEQHAKWLGALIELRIRLGALGWLVPGIGGHADAIGTDTAGKAAAEQQGVNEIGLQNARDNEAWAKGIEEANKTSTEEAKRYNDAIAQAVKESEKLALFQDKKTLGIETDRQHADELLAAAKLGTAEYNDQVDVIAVQNKLLADGVYWFDARYEAAKKSVEITVAEHRETEAIVKAREQEATKAKEAATRAAEEAARPFKEMMKQLQGEFATFFDNIFTKGIKSFSDLVTSIKAMFLKMIAELLAADLMKKLAGVLGAMMAAPAAAGAQSAAGGSGGMLSGLGTQMAGQAAMGGLAGGAVGYGVGSMTTNPVLGALGGAASGAATGFMLAGPIGAVAGGLAGLVGGLMGAGNAARQAAEALRAMQLAEAQVGATLADWRAQITGTAADQKAAALMDLKYKYMEIVAEIQRLEAGKKMEAQRNADLAEAARLYALNFTAITNNTAALQALTELNVVSGYKLQATIFAAMSPGGGGFPTHGSPLGSTMPGVNPLGPNTGPGGLSPSGGSGDLTVPLVLDGRVVAQVVLKNFRGTAQRQFGDSTKWSAIQ